jgi:hypothetical protein
MTAMTIDSKYSRATDFLKGGGAAGAGAAFGGAFFWFFIVRLSPSIVGVLSLES